MGISKLRLNRATTLKYFFSFSLIPLNEEAIFNKEQLSNLVEEQSDKKHVHTREYVSNDIGSELDEDENDELN